MKYYLFILLILGISTTGYSQKFDWVSFVVDSSNRNDYYVNKVVQLVSEDGGHYMYFLSRNEYPFGSYSIHNKLNNHGQNFLVKYNNSGVLQWWHQFNAADINFDVEDGNVIVAISRYQRFDIDTLQVLNNSGFRKSALLSLDAESGKLNWVKESPTYSSALWPAAISVMDDNILVAMQNQSRRSYYIFGSDSTIIPDSFYSQILMCYSMDGEFKNYQQRNYLLHPGREAEIIGVANDGKNFTVHYGRPNLYSPAFDRREFVSSHYITSYDPYLNEETVKVKIAGKTQFYIRKVLPILDDRYLIHGSLSSPYYELQERFKLNTQNFEERLDFVSLMDKDGAVLWSKTAIDTNFITDIAYDAKHENVYYTETQKHSSEEQIQTGFRSKLVLHQLDINFQELDSVIMYPNLVSTGFSPLQPRISYDDGLIYGNRVLEIFDSTYFEDSVALNFTSFAMAKVKFSPEKITPHYLDEMWVYPNPCDGYIIIRHVPQAVYGVEAFDVTGRKIRSLSFDVKDEYIVIYTYDLASGIYLIKLDTNAGSKTFIIQKFNG